MTPRVWNSWIRLTGSNEIRNFRFGVLAAPDRFMATTISVVNRLLAVVALLFVLCACHPKSDSAGLISEIESYRVQGFDPRPQYDRIVSEYSRLRRSGNPDCAGLRIGLVDVFFEWGCFDEAWTLFATTREGAGGSGKRLLLIRRAIQCPNPSDLDGFEDAQWVRATLDRCRKRYLEPDDVREICSIFDVGLTAAIATALMADGDTHSAKLVCVVGLRTALVSLRQNRWDGVDHGRDNFNGITANSIVLWRVYAACVLDPKLSVEANDQSADEALTMANSLYRSFHERKDRSKREREYLDAMWTIACQVAGRAQSVPEPTSPQSDL
jgi:hypothetical protein